MDLSNKQTLSISFLLHNLRLVPQWQRWAIYAHGRWNVLTIVLLSLAIILAGFGGEAQADPRNHLLTLTGGYYSGSDRVIAASGSNGDLAFVGAGGNVAPSKTYILGLPTNTLCSNGFDFQPRAIGTLCSATAYPITINGWHEASIVDVNSARSYLLAITDLTTNCSGGPCHYFSTSSNNATIAAVNIDEPYLGTTASAGIDHWISPCTTGDSRRTTVGIVRKELQFLAQAVHQLAPKTRFWVNLSEPEMQWMLSGNCSSSDRNSLNVNLNSSLFDVISMDKYDTAFSLGSSSSCPSSGSSQSSVQPYYDCMINTNKLFAGQQLALFPCTQVGLNSVPGFSGCTGSNLSQYFNYATSKNQFCNKPLRATGTTGYADGCPVWAVAGWASDQWTNGNDTGAVKFTWNAQYNKVVSIPSPTNPAGTPDSMAGYVESISVASGPHQGGDIVITGWAVDNFTLGAPVYIDVWETNSAQVRQFVGETTSVYSRPDVSPYYPSGFSISISIWQYFTPGCHVFSIYAIAPSSAAWNYVQLPTASGVNATVCL